MAHRKQFLTKNKRDSIASKVHDELKQKNTLKPAITKKSVTLAKTASLGEFRRGGKMTQRTHCSILTKPSKLKENRKQSIRKQSLDSEGAECSFKPKINTGMNEKIGYFGGAE